MSETAITPMKKRPLLAALLGVVGLFLGYLFFWPVPFDPAPDAPLGQNPAGTGVYVKNNKLAEAKIIATPPGPEGLALDAAGNIYAGLEDGRIIRVRDGAVTTLTNTQGRPLGIEFDADGNLIIADIYTGLLSMAPDGALTPLVSAYQGEKMLFVDDLAIAGDGKIYFTDASTHWGYHDNLLEAFERRPNGRLYVYDPADGRTQLLLDKLHFANGVALGPEDAFVVVNETFSHRITRLWLTGPRAVRREIFAENLPGFVDNITEAPDGGFWVALVNARSPALDALVPSPFLRKIVWRLIMLTGSNPAIPHSYAVKLDTDGRPLVSWEDDSGHIFNMTSVIEHRGMLYLGTLTEPQIGVLPAP